MTGFLDFVMYGLAILMCLVFLYAAYGMGGTYEIPAIPIINPNPTPSYYYFPEVKANADPWYSRVVLPGEMEATVWINDNTNKSDKFVADIFGAELIMGMTTRVSTVGGDWANAPNPVKYMTDTNEIYKTSDPQEASRLAKENNCSYVLLPERNTFSGFDWTYGDHEKFDDPEYFRLMYENPDVKIYKVL